MPSITGTFVSCAAWAALSVATALSLGGCHYTEAQKWAVCCALYVIKDKAPEPSARATIIEWQGVTMFGGDGSAADLNDLKSADSNKRRQIKLEIANFLADRPRGQASDYFRSLGMTCGPATPSTKVGVTRCDLELPIQVECGPTYRFLPGTTPIPKEMQGLLPAPLRTSVDLSADTLIDVTTRSDPIPGGHLCHR
jgi:hypothetical protein